MFKKIFYLIICYIFPAKFFSYNKSFFSRIKFDDYVFNEISELKNKSQQNVSLSAIYRVKNGEATIRNSILSIAPLCNEIIFVDNMSTDSTVSIVSSLQKELDNICKIRIFNYEQELAIAGEGYIDIVHKYPNKSLAKYYKYAFSLAKSDYVIKCDAHCIYFPAEIKKIQKMLSRNPKVIYFRGCEIYGKKLNFEPYIFRSDSGYEYVDDNEYERLIIEDSILNKIKYSIFRPVFIHIKRVSYITMIKDINRSVSRLYK
ncbi:hypothetical protein C0W40_14160 [Photobacterium leiognathi subsp. mandapamensis]|uniref:glycosyltransferase family 2 protein n=1 Tax=Photobacterium leiognathi TaxID=553611 RepID=UPI000D158DF7|nr:glycosyltransferase [Photobacterium leiognathi]PSW42963.1 hypothetical protein C0W40_14160 [Photobacterium leiognathi subsp. mandapamensis]